MNTAVLEDIEQVEAEEFQTMGSFNHGYFQIRLGVLLSKTDEYTVAAELSLDVSKLDLSQFEIKSKEEVKPDLCVYPRRRINRSQDILRMTEMPLLAIEILSPLQGIQTILNKFRVYFALGVRSCWLVEPAIGAVAVYHDLDKPRTFSSGEVIDEVAGIRLLVEEIFG
ncbi:MAG: Uma2 family endonuclease [Candidatus Competibacteraceae bacterium]